MARAKYTITESDFVHARAYLQSQVGAYALTIRDDVTFAQLQTELNAIATGPKATRVSSLNTWCETNLTAADWTKMKPAIRKRRERRERSADQKTVTMSAKAHGLLTKLASRDGVTLSQALETYLAQAVKNRGRSAAKR